MEHESPARRWARRATILAAALACVATSKAGWTMQATLPPELPPSALGGKLVVEATLEPNVVTLRTSDEHRWTPPREERGAWSGKGTYYLPPGVSLQSVSIRGDDCTHQGGLCEKCEAPKGTFVRVASLEAVAVWTASATSGEAIAHVDGAGSGSYVVVVKGTRPFDFEVFPTGTTASDLTPSPYRDTPDDADESRFIVSWYRKDANRKDAIDGHWRVRATIHGPCPGKEPCSAPAGESVEIVSLGPKY